MTLVYIFRKYIFAKLIFQKFCAIFQNAIREYANKDTPFIFFILNYIVIIDRVLFSEFVYMLFNFIFQAKNNFSHKNEWFIQKVILHKSCLLRKFIKKPF